MFFSQGDLMAFTFICPKGAIAEGGLGFFQAGKKNVLVVWPAGEDLKAYRGRCPDADVPLNEAKFDGRILTCPHHHWGFDVASGKCVTHTTAKTLHPYPVRVEGDEIQVDVGPVKAPRAPA
jgi:toluene monooxygenase system ferredoxin subunit